jgi:hypothetical protein
MSSDSFQAMIDKRRAHMKMLHDRFDRDGYLFASSARDPGYSILLTRNPSSDAPFRVTSFDSGVPTGHREYDALDGAGPCRESLAEFASEDMRLRRRGAISALCLRTRVVGTGNSFEVLVPLSEIDPEGQNYRVIRPDHGNCEFVPFHLGIEPYVSEIVCMPPGFERYERFKVHEAASKAKELAILQHAFPESHLAAMPFLWNSGYLADRQVTVRIDREGNLVRPVVPRPVACPAVAKLEL